MILSWTIIAAFIVSAVLFLIGIGLLIVSKVIKKQNGDDWSDINRAIKERRGSYWNLKGLPLSRKLYVIGAGLTVPATVILGILIYGMVMEQAEQSPTRKNIVMVVFCIFLAFCAIYGRKNKR